MVQKIFLGVSVLGLILGVYGFTLTIAGVLGDEQKTKNNGVQLMVISIALAGFVFFFKPKPQCPNCGASYRYQTAYCIACGHALQDICNNCGSVLSSEESYCPNCGEQVN